MAYYDCLCDKDPAYAKQQGINCNTYTQLYWYHPDYLGNTEFITDAGGYPYQFFYYSAFGESLVQQSANTGSFDSPYRFNAKEQDPETGNYYYGARYYNPQTSIWFGVDPLAHQYPHLTPYNFVEGNPIMLIDPTGMGSQNPHEWEVNLATGESKQTGTKGGDQTDYITYVNGQGNQVGNTEVKKVEERKNCNMLHLLPNYGRGPGYRTVTDQSINYDNTIESFILGNYAVKGIFQLGKWAWGAAFGEATVAASEASILAAASRAAFNAADDVGSIFIKNKHLSNASGKWAKFDTSDISTAQGWVRNALRSPNAKFLPNDQIPNTFQVVTNLGTTIGTKGETSIRVIVGFDGKVINAFPVK